VKPALKFTQAIPAVSSVQPLSAAEEQIVAEPEATFSMVTA